jgi:HEAT repeat protein
MRIFISYQRENQPFAESLRKRLHDWKLDTWMDVHDIPDGSHWPDEIDRGLRASDVVVGIMSPLAMESRNVKNEWDWAIVNKKRLILLLLEPCSIHMNYVSLNYIDFTRDHTSAYERLRLTLHSSETAAAPSTDSYLDYLQALYTRINDYLGRAIIARATGKDEAEPIHLLSDRTAGAVDALFERRDEVDPFFEINFGDAPKTDYSDFGEVFEHFNRRVLLLGEPGAGKTITLFHFAREAVVRRIQDVNQPLPILATLPTWKHRDNQSLTEWLATSYGAPKDAARLIEEGRALLLLDGLDELGSESPLDPNNLNSEKYDPRKRLIERLRDLPEANQVLITCRVEDYATIDAKIALHGAVTLRLLTDAQIKDYLRDLPDLWQALENDPDLLTLCRTPLLLSFFAFAYKQMSDAQRADELRQLSNLGSSPGDLRDRIFETYVKGSYEREARKLKARGEPIPFTYAETHGGLSEAAFQNVTDGYGEENVIPLLGSGKTNPFQLDFTLTPELAQWTIRLYLLTPSGSTYRFVHLRLRDYFAFPLAVTRLRAGDWTSARALGAMKDRRAVEPLIEALSSADAVTSIAAGYALGKVGEDGFAALLAALNHTKSHVRRVTVNVLGKLGDKRALDSLVVVLRDENKWVRESTTDALVKLRDVRAVEPMLATLKDDDADIRRRAINVLGVLGDLRAVEPLLALLSDENNDVRKASIVALGDLGDKRAVEPLIELLPKEKRNIASTVVEALGRLGDLRAVEPLIAVLSNKDALIYIPTAKALGALGDARAVDALYAKLSGDSGGFFAEALEKLGEQGFLALLKALEHENHRVRRVAAESLGRLGNVRAVDSLAVALRDEDKQVYYSAAVALAKLGEAGLNALVLALRDENSRVQITALETLGRFGHAQSVEPMAGMLKAENPEVRTAAANALGKLGYKAAVEPLVISLHDKDRGVRFAAATALGDLGDIQALEPLLSLLRDVERDSHIAAAEAIGKLGDVGFAALINALQDTKAEVRHAAATALGKLYKSNAVEPLIALLQDDDMDVRTAAVEALGKIGDKQAVEPLIVMLQDKEADIRQVVASVLGKFKDSRTFEPLVALLHDESPSVRGAAIGSLDNLKDIRAVKPLINMLRDETVVSTAGGRICDGAVRALKSMDTPEAQAALKDWQSK